MPPLWEWRSKKEAQEAHDDLVNWQSTLVMTKFMCSPWRPLPEPQKWFYSKATCGELWLRDKSHVHRDTACDRAGTKSPQSFLLCYRPLMALELRLMGDPEWGKHGLICKTERFSWLDSSKVCVLTSMNSFLSYFHGLSGSLLCARQDINIWDPRASQHAQYLPSWGLFLVGAL